MDRAGRQVDQTPSTGTTEGSRAGTWVQISIFDVLMQD